MIVLGVPVINQHKFTKQLIDSLITTVTDHSNFKLVIVDNNSDTRYKAEDYDTPFKVEVLFNEQNEGYYYPLQQLYENHSSDTDLIGVVHNDIIFYEAGWNKRMGKAFAEMDTLGLVGLCGSNEVDILGGRGGGTMCCFNGTKGQPRSTGYCDSSLRPALVLDSLFMLFRRSIVPQLKIEKTIVPCHFMDRIWPLKVIDMGYRVGVMGVEIDHLGGVTECAEPKYHTEAIKWCERNGVDHQGNPNHAIYKLGEKLYLDEYREQRHIIPCRISQNWAISR